MHFWLYIKFVIKVVDKPLVLSWNDFNYIKDAYSKNIKSLYCDLISILLIGVKDTHSKS